MASGGAMTLTREPSGRRASQLGSTRRARRPTWLTMRWRMFAGCWLSAKAHTGLLHLAADFDERRAGAGDHDIGDVVARQAALAVRIPERRCRCPRAVLLLGNRHHDVLDLDDLADDVANFFARSAAIQLGKLRQVDGVDQCIEHRRLDIVVLFQSAAAAARQQARVHAARAPVLLPVDGEPPAPVQAGAEAGACGAIRFGVVGSLERRPNIASGCP